MGWFRVKDRLTDRQILPKDAILLIPGQTPPPMYRFAYVTILNTAGYITGPTPGDPLASSGPLVLKEDYEVERHVYVPDILQGED